MENNKLFIRNSELIKLTSLGHGAHGECYKYGNLVLKEMYDFSTITCPYGYYNNSYLLPQKELYIDNVYSGFVMDYYHGDNLSLIDDEFTFEDFYNSLDKLIGDTKMLSKDKLFIVDMYRYNILFNIKNGYKVCDTQEYYLDNSSSYRDVLKHNIYSLNCGIYNSIFKINELFIREFINQNTMYKFIADDEDFTYKFIEDLYNFSCNYINENIENVGEYKKLVKR